MASFDPILADIRFGCGLSPTIASPASAEAMLATLDQPDRVAEQFPIEDYDTFLKRSRERLALSVIRRKQSGTPEALQARKDTNKIYREARLDQHRWMAAHLARRMTTTAPLRERLTFFWADHFTATGKGGETQRATSPYIESAIRPYISEHFETLLIHAVTHPVMVMYLDQNMSIGPKSKFALARRGKKQVGVNENLAREVLELHTLGVDGPYTQDDIREFAKLLTGLSENKERGKIFRKEFAEPGAETVLGVSYGGDGEPSMRDIHAALRDLARHPATAKHLARKLAVHFVSDTPDPELVAAVEKTLLETRANLRAAYTTLLNHPASWSSEGANAKQPLDFMGSALRALAPDPETLLGLKEKQLMSCFLEPMEVMGQSWEKPVGPDGLDEIDSAWITPQGLAARLQWAMSVPQVLRPELPDPREFVTHALGTRATPAVQFAAKAAESRADGIGLILASPAFQRM